MTNKKRGAVLLDPFSTSQTNDKNGEAVGGSVSIRLADEMLSDVEQSRAIQALRCEKYAPYIFVKKDGRGRLVQGCCNSWNCARCGQIRAREEYGRIVEGARALAGDGHTLYFWTLTCKGRDVPLSEAEKNYPLWTNRLLTNARLKATRAKDFWCYVQVTERQQRGHPHSHLLTTYVPNDAVEYKAGDMLPNGRKASRDTLWSQWYREANVKAGLGVECDISLVRSPVAVAVYLSKYLFKDAQETIWGKGWRRVRYSNNFPKLPPTPPDEAYPVNTSQAWIRVGTENAVLYCTDKQGYELAKRHLKSDTLLIKGYENE